MGHRLVSFLYLRLLFAIAYLGDRRADAGRSIIANPHLFALAGGLLHHLDLLRQRRACCHDRIGFLPIYLGPTLMMPGCGGCVMLKMIRIIKANRITSIADFVSSRYGKSHVARVAWSPSLPWSASCPTSRCNSRRSRTAYTFCSLPRPSTAGDPAEVRGRCSQDSALYIA